MAQVPMYDADGNIIGYEDDGTGDGTTGVEGGDQSGAQLYQDALGNWFATQEEAQASDAANNAAPTATGSPAWSLATLKDRYFTNGTPNLANIAKDGLTLASAIQAYQNAANPPKTGYQGGIPSLVASRAQVPTAQTTRPGAGGQRFFTDTTYSTAAGVPAAQTATQNQATTLTAQNQANSSAQSPAQSPVQIQAAQDAFYGRTPAPGLVGVATRARDFMPGEEVEMPSPGPVGGATRARDFMTGEEVPAIDTSLFAPSTQANVAAGLPAAQGGLMGLAKGGTPNAPRYLQGKTDGMADEIPAQIDGNQPAALAHGEFVVPADVVSHLGNGNSDAGADVLYKMMDKIRKARTGTTKQGKEIDPNKFTPGGLAYAAGGAVQHFDGTTGSTVGANGVLGTESNLSNWAGPYVTNMLGQGAALAAQPYQAYQGPLTAGDSALQTQAYGLAGGLQTPASIGQAATTAGTVAQSAGNLNYNPTAATNQFTAPTTYSPTTSAFDSTQAQAYMNPYLKQSLDPQLAEARRQSEISQQTNNAQATTAGAFGGARQGIMAAEGQRNLGANLANITGQGYNTAYNNAQQQFNADQARKMQEAQFGAQQGMTGAQQTAQFGQQAQAQNAQEAQFGANYGLQGLNTQLQAAQAQGQLGVQQNQAGLANLNEIANLGATQQATQQAGVAADKAAFEAERDNPYKMVQYQQSLLQGLPLAAQQYTTSTNPYYAAAGAAADINKAVGP